MAKNFLSRHKFRILSVIGFITIILLMTNFADNRKNVDEGILNMAGINPDNSMPPDCKTVFDSLDRIKLWKKSRLSAGNSISTFFIGVSKIDECDSFNGFQSVANNPCLKTKYFILLPGYTVKEDASFFIKKDKYYVGYEIWDEIYANNFRTGHNATKEVEVRYAPGFSDKGGYLLIPISKRTYDIMHVLVVALTITFILASFFLLIIFPYTILVNIARGDPFTKSNIRKLYILSWTLISCGLLSSLIPKIIELFLKNKPAEIYFPFLLSLTDVRPLFIAGVVVLLIASAFKRGYKLQQEQDLTI